MKPKALIILGAVTAALVGVAIVTQRTGAPPAGVFHPQPLAPGLDARLNDATRIVMTKAERALTLERKGEGWVVASKDGYPAQFEPIKQLLLVLAQTQLVEPKTANEAHFGRLGVDDPPGGQGNRLEVSDASGAALATVVLGNTAGPPGKEQSEAFVRTGALDRAFLARAAGQAALAFDPDPMSFIERTLFQVDRPRVREVVIERPGEPPVRLARQARDQAEPTLDGMPAGRELKYPGVLGQAAGALSYVSITDVAGAAAVDFEKNLKAMARFTTFDGLVLTIRSAEKDGVVWSSIEAAMEEGWEGRAADEAAAEARRRLENEAKAKAQGPDLEAPSAEVPAVDQEALAKAEQEARAGADADLKARRDEIESINAKVRGWAFDLSSWRSEQLTAGLEYFLKAVEAPPAPPPAFEEPVGLPPPPMGLPPPPR